MTIRPHDVDVAEDVGIIVPPPEVKEILETTAGHVGKNPALEARVLQEHQNDPRFIFLQPDNPYHAYYRRKVDEVRALVKGPAKPPLEKPAGSDDSSQSNGKPSAEDDVAKEQHDPNKQTTEGKAVVSFLKSVQAKEEAARPEPRDPPPEDVFTIINVNPAPHALGLDVMKLTAQFSAKHGPEFITALSSKESRNTLFDFLKPLHPHFILFQRLVDAYRAILDTGEQKDKLVTKLEAYAKNEQAVLDDVWYLHDWECQRAEREHEAKIDESEKLKAAQIDWHDFVVLETIDLDDNEENLPAPVADARQLPKILAAAKKAEHEREKNRGDVDMDVDADTTQTAKDGMVVTVNANADIPADRIRKAGLKAAGNVGSAQSVGEATVVLPSGQQVPLSKAEASMRAELLNPSYKEERARAAEKNRQQNLASGEEIARSLARLGKTRTEAGVFNRGDLQEKLAVLPRPSPEEADREMAKAEASGPKQPGQDEEVVQPAKRARVERAVDALSKQKVVEEEVEVREETKEDQVAGLVSAEEWIKKQGPTAVVRIKMPVHANREWDLQGQEMQMSATLKSTVGKLKAVVAKFTKLPANKQKLSLEGVGFLKDKMALAAYNLKDGAVVKLDVKERGGRKKH